MNKFALMPLVIASILWGAGGAFAVEMSNMSVQVVNTSTQNSSFAQIADGSNQQECRQKARTICYPLREVPHEYNNCIKREVAKCMGTPFKF
ncbi:MULTISPECIES: hypothetical protein [Brucella/Ochrobactrum group]|uniref:Uncharacterized protein n=1 Tax=Brucella anthropi (strain ATCC 49188 / DSM 6882 / CCUG 24695 / JCM 21032 / LMG 3331 / NBRC 15819 / NCTC 12168 / Alc 37) TaxID=439375 RepID=A6X2L5_BRUA4|nr:MULTISPECIES: hypothetical protein [Brucella/Ochrobactrum group]RNL42684.1 hypothetical protein D7I41_16330 [Ochrobactrum sp. MH181795]ABS15469.1 hypothetical protein Oant_2759 [Brucella anthropi ATCC 49188]AIK41825.1 hypothetical protein DR92_3786 [Brucella anthropi]KAB2724012.1 hypothetical protein F9K76_19570 [Brucella anthropi]KAB2725271.1 hypothetical protein F9K90_23505 [Brucella anthropi]